MYSHSIEIRVRYGETDQMGYLHHSNYARYYEVARVELMRALGFPYGEMEISGILMPVLNLECKFIGAILYDELVTVTAIITELPASRMKLHYEIHNEKGKKVNEGKTDLCFVKADSRRPMRCPEKVLQLVEMGFDSEGI